MLKTPSHSSQCDDNIRNVVIYVESSDDSRVLYSQSVQAILVQSCFIASVWIQSIVR